MARWEADVPAVACGAAAERNGTSCLEVNAEEAVVGTLGGPASGEGRDGVVGDVVEYDEGYDEAQAGGAPAPATFGTGRDPLGFAASSDLTIAERPPS